MSFRAFEGMCFAGLLFALLSPAWGQSTARLAGLVKDPSGAVVADAVISLYRPGMTEAAITAKTTNVGLFEFDALPPEVYTVVIEKPGFAPFEAKDVSLSPGSETTLNNIQLAVGQKRTVVEASEGLRGIQTSNAEISTTLSTEQLERLPILNRNPLTLIQTQAGIVGRIGSNTFTAIDALRTSYSNVTMDGINVQDNYVRAYALDVLPNGLTIGQVSQFTLVTSNQSSTYGNGVTQTAFVTPSGTNDLHGSVFYLNSNSPMNANTWIRDSQGLQGANKSNLGGFSAGGPLIKNKLFAYANYEFFRRRNSVGLRRETLTAAQRNTFAAAIASSQVMSQLVSVMPLPNVAGTDIYAYEQRSTADTDNSILKFDYVPSEKHTIVASWLWTRIKVDTGLSNFNVNQAVVEHQKANLFSLSWRFSVTPHFTNEVRFGANLAPIAFINRERTAPYILNLSKFEFANPISPAGHQGRTLRTYDFQDNASYIFGPHNLQFGFQSQLIRISAYLEFGSVPSIFLGDGTSDASIFRGVVNQIGYQFFPVNRSGTYGAAPLTTEPTLDNYAFYVQDNWKPVRRLSITAGLRYDYYTPVSDAKGLLFSPELVNGNVLQTFASPAITYDLKGHGFYQPDKNNFAPNIGIAFDPFGNGRTSLRAGYGIMFANDEFAEAVGYNLGFNGQNFGGCPQTSPPLPTLASISPASIPPFAGFPFSLPNSAKVKAVTADNSCIDPTAVFMVDPHLRVPYIQQWNASVQHSYAGFVLDLRYVGNHAAKMLRQDKFAVGDNFAYYLSNLSSASYNAVQFDVSRRLRPSLQFQANYTFAHSLTDSGNDARALDPFRDSNNHRLDRGPSAFDIRHAFKTNLIYDLPFKPEHLKPLLSGWSISTILIGQSGAPFSVVRNLGTEGYTGVLLQDTVNTSLAGAALDKIISFHLTPNGASIIAPSAINPTTGTGTGFFQGQVFFVPASGPGQLQPRRFYGPASFDWDLGIQKRFKLTEKHSVELRGVAVNVLNHPSWGFPNQDITRANFGGQNASTLYPQRTVQLSAYYRF